MGSSSLSFFRPAGLKPSSSSSPLPRAGILVRLHVGTGREGGLCPRVWMWSPPPRSSRPISWRGLGQALPHTEQRKRKWQRIAFVLTLQKMCSSVGPTQHVTWCSWRGAQHLCSTGPHGQEAAGSLQKTLWDQGVTAQDRATLAYKGGGDFPRSRRKAAELAGRCSADFSCTPQTFKAGSYLPPLAPTLPTLLSLSAPVQTHSPSP